MSALGNSVQPGSRAVPAKVHLALVAVQIAFATLAVEGKLVMTARYGVSPPALAMVRIVGGALVFVALHLALRTPRVRSLPDALRLGALSLFGVVVNQALFLRGLSMTSAIAATLLVATIPIFAALVAVVARRDRITARSAAGTALAVVGIAVLSHFALPHRGDVLVLLNSLSYAIYVVFAKDLLARYGPITVVAWVFGLGVVLFAPLGAVALAQEAPGWSGPAAGLVAFVVLVPTVFAYAVNAWALQRATPTLVTIYIYLQPLVVAVLAWVQLGQPITPHAALAAVLILAGVTIVAAAPRQSMPAPVARPH